MICRRCGFSFADDLSICPSCRTPAAEPPAWLFVSDSVPTAPPTPAAPSVPPPRPPAQAGSVSDDPALVETQLSGIPPLRVDDPGYSTRRAAAWAEAFPETAPPPRSLSSNPWLNFNEDSGERPRPPVVAPPSTPVTPAPVPTAPPRPWPADPPQRSAISRGPVSLDPLPPVSLAMEEAAGATLAAEASPVSSPLGFDSSVVSRPPARQPMPSPSEPASATPPVIVPLSPVASAQPVPPLSSSVVGPAPLASIPENPVPLAEPVMPQAAGAQSSYSWAPLPETKVPEALFMGNRLPATPGAETSLRPLRAPEVVSPEGPPTPPSADGVIAEENQGREDRHARTRENRSLTTVLILGLILLAVIVLAVAYTLFS